MGNRTREVVLRLAEEIGHLLDSIPASARAGLNPQEQQRLEEARRIASSLTRDSCPKDLMALRQVEVSLIGALEVLKRVELPTDLGLKAAAAWALYREDMVRRKRAASGTQNWSIEDEINAPGDDSVN